MSGFLVDTHLLLWWLLEPARVPRRAANALADRGVPMYYSISRYKR